MRIVIDRKRRQRVALDRNRVVCTHPFRDGEPAGYVAWHEWASRQPGGRARACATSGCPLPVWPSAPPPVPGGRT